MLKFYINLDRSPARRQKLTSRLSELGQEFTRIAGVEGNKLNDEYCDSIQYSINDPEIRARYTRQLNKAEIGTFLSHRKCWQALIDSDEDYVLVIEDDLIISDRAKEYFANTNWIPKDCDIVRLICFDLEKDHLIENESRIKLENGDELIVQLSPKPIGCQGYILSRKAASYALEHSKMLPCPVDDFLFTLMFDVANTFKCWQLNPCVIRTDPDEKSDIGSRAKNDIKNLKAPFYIRHGLRRFLLKRRIAKIQRQGIKADLSFK